jgi:hypothetical protein
MYAVLLTIHSWLRWILVALAVALFVALAAGWLRRRPWQPLNDNLSQLFTAGLDLQMVAGIALFAASGRLLSGLSAGGAAAPNSAGHFLTFEHIPIMIVAVVLAHLGRLQLRRAPQDDDRYRIAGIFFGLAFAMMLAAVPWPFLPAGDGRPWFRI